MPGRLTKSKERVKKHAEVFTPIHIVQKMVDLVDEEESGVDVYAAGKTWLEPSCGNGVFLGEIARRKLAKCMNVEQALNMLKDIYGIDIQEDNVQQARCQVMGQFTFWALNAGVHIDALLFWKAMLIVEKNIVCGDFLKPETICLTDWKNNKQFMLSEAQYD